ncbi:MAG: rhodanese-like domain-containing protein [Aeromonadales bacterium]|nr:rhodanese-like domain-containing protein [Aeromonadales bacterium]
MENQSITINPGITKIEPFIANTLIESNQCLLIDVREKDEYEQGYVPPAINLSVSSFDSEHLNKVAPDKAKPVILYCRSGRRSAEAALKMKALGYYYILDMGGILSWPYIIVRP